MRYTSPMTAKNPAAVALGKLNKGRKKTMTKAALRQRKRAAKRPRPRTNEPSQK